MEIISVLSNSIALFFLWMFISAGLNKLMPSNRPYYQDVFKDYGIALPELATIMVCLLGSIEVLSGLLSVFPATRLLGLIGCGSLLSLYMLAMATQLRQGKLDMDCGCAGPAGLVKVSPALLLRNLLLIGLLSVCWFDIFWLENTVLNLNYWLLSTPVAVLLILIHQSSEQLLANAQKLKLLKAVM